MTTTVVACAVCFGQSDAPMAIATNMGILTLLIVIVGVLVGFGAFFVYLNRRARLVAAAELGSSPVGVVGMSAAGPQGEIA
jgi:maltodextrin utilization protein YvdJ